MTEITIRDAKSPDIPDLHRLIESAYRGESSRAGWTTEADLLGGQRTDPDDLADILADLSPAQLIKIASGNMMMCRFRFDDEMVWSLLSEHGRRSPQGLDGNASRLHASIVMAGNFAEAV